MKPTNQIIAAIALFCLLCISTNNYAQETPQYITVTTMHWNMDMEDFDMDTWKAVEKEYLEKVTKKNDLVMGAGFYLHQMTPDNTEIVYVRVFGTWDAIEKASAKDSELEKAAWPDKEAREAFLKKQNAYYTRQHSDEIYSTMSLVKHLPENNKKDLICYIRTNHFAYPEDGKNAEIRELMSENFEKLVKHNPLIKGYYPHRHAWGKDSTEMMEAFFLESMADLEKMFDGLPDLAKKAWPNEAARKERSKKFDKYFTGVHGDAVYKLVAELSK